MKTIIYGLLVIAFAICAAACKIWAIVAFVLYLFKDRPFDWWSIWGMLISYPLILVFYLLMQFAKDSAVTNNYIHGRKSGFQLRLEDMAKKKSEIK